MYRLLDHFWHEAHARRLDAVPVQRDYIWHDNWPKWNEKSRPFPANRIVDHYTPGIYDAVICHVDEVTWRYPSMAPQFRELRPIVKEPIIVINHGTPEDEIDALMMRDWLTGCHMVVNSEQAARDWGFGTPIIHGYDATEWPVNEAERPAEIVTCIKGRSMYHDEYNGWDVLERLRYALPITCIGLDEKPESFDAYRATLSRGTIYANPTRRSPMPGARSEAMLMGLCIVTTANHDADKYIEDGKTGLLAGDMPEFEEKLRWAWAHPAEARVMGMAGAEAARRHFSPERYAADWLRLLAEVVGK
jgi:hypothetical protein